jgi:hypothetical protein
MTIHSCSVWDEQDPNGCKDCEHNYSIDCPYGLMMALDREKELHPSPALDLEGVLREFAEFCEEIDPNQIRDVSESVKYFLAARKNK